MRIIINDIGYPLWILYLLTIVVIGIRKFRQKKGLPYLTCFAVFWVYIYFCLNEVFFPISINGEYVNAMREIPFQSFLNLVPFHYGKYGFNSHVLVEMLLNVLLTFPFGFGLNFIKKVKRKLYIWIPIALGFGIELLQLFISLILRYPYRVIDINDSIMNTFGALIGFGFFKLFSWIFISITNTFKLKHRGLSAYIYEVVR